MTGSVCPKPIIVTGSFLAFTFSVLFQALGASRLTTRRPRSLLFRPDPLIGADRDEVVPFFLPGAPADSQTDPLMSTNRASPA